MTICPCGKIPHPTEVLADAHLRQLAKKKIRPTRLLRVYQCVSGSWHVGHLPVRKTAR